MDVSYRFFLSILFLRLELNQRFRTLKHNIPANVSNPNLIQYNSSNLYVKSHKLKKTKQ